MSYKQLLYLQFFKLKLYRFLGIKKLKVNSPVVCTEDSVLEMGKEYIYREGAYRTPIKLRNISFSKFFMAVDLEFLKEDNRLETCEHKITIDFTYPGIWQLWDKNSFSKKYY